MVKMNHRLSSILRRNIITGRGAAIIWALIASCTLTACVATQYSDENQTDLKVESKPESGMDSIMDSKAENNSKPAAANSNNSMIKDRSKVEHDYVHGDDGYFSLADEGIVTSVKSQLSGTCWVTAAATSLESSYKISYGEDIVVDPIDILKPVLCDEKTEGYLANEGTDVYDIGGTSWQITETLSNGFGDYILVESQDYLDTDIDTIKEGIINEGAITIGVNDTGYYRYDGYKTLIASKEDGADHSVTLIGFDDNFPKEYFKHEASQNGAWLAQNTRGEFWGTNGRFWISYDTPFEEIILLKMSDEYDGVLAYDGGCENTIKVGEKTTTANVFHNKCTLKGVGTYITKPGQKIKIDIYDDSFQKLLYSQEACYDLKGYYVTQLDEELEVDDFAITVTYDGEAPVEAINPELFGISYLVDISAGESFVNIDDMWIDMSEDDIENKLGIDFRPNNCCIKAIY